MFRRRYRILRLEGRWSRIFLGINRIGHIYLLFEMGGMLIQVDCCENATNLLRFKDTESTPPLFERNRRETES